MEKTADQLLLEKLPSDEAIDALFKKYSKLVYSACLGILCDRDLADDATQSVFLTLLQKGHSLTRHASLAGWLYVAAVRTALGMARAERKRRVREALLVSAEEETGLQLPDPDLIRALSKLRPLDREVVVLRFAQEMSFEEIGRQVDLTSDAARRRVDRALLKLRGKMAGAEVSGLLSTAFATRGRLQALKTPAVTLKRFSLGVTQGFTVSHLAAAVGPFAVAGFIAIVGFTSRDHRMPYKFKTPAGPYRLTYSFVTRSIPAGRVINRGAFTLTEKNHALMMQAKGIGHTDVAVYAHGRTLRFHHEPSKEDGAIYEDDFNGSEDELMLYMPFNYESVRIFRPLADLAVQRDQWAKDVRIPKAVREQNAKVDEANKKFEADSNLSFAFVGGLDGQAVQAARFVPAKGPGEPARLLLGTPHDRGADIVYSDIRTAMGIGVPAHISMTLFAYKKQYDPKAKTATMPVSTVEFSLKSIVTDGAKITTPTPEAMLRKGEWIDYTGRGKNAGVHYDPSAGSLDAQVQCQLDMSASRR